MHLLRATRAHSRSTVDAPTALFRHQAQLGWRASGPADRDAWAGQDFNLAVRTATPAAWRRALAAGFPVVHDAGFTEVTPGSQTAAAVLPCFWLYADLGERLAAGAFGDVANDPGHPYATWLRTYGDPAFSLANRRAIDLVTGLAAAATPAVRERMRRAFRVSSEHELAFFAAPLLQSSPAREGAVA